MAKTSILCGFSALVISSIPITRLFLCLVLIKKIPWCRPVFGRHFLFSIRQPLFRPSGWKNSRRLKLPKKKIPSESPFSGLADGKTLDDLSSQQGKFHPKARFQAFRMENKIFFTDKPCNHPQRDRWSLLRCGVPAGRLLHVPRRRKRWSRNNVRAARPFL